MPPQTPSSLTDDGEWDPIEQVAANWMIQRDHGLSASQAAEFARWLQADHRHAAAFEALAATWELMGDTPVSPATIAEENAGRAHHWRWIPAGLAAAAAIAGGVFWSAYSKSAAARSVAPFATLATTEIGAWRKVDLPDGSVIQLNTNSQIEVSYTSVARRVLLARGEAHFTVAKNPERPFLVTAGDVEMRAVGTAFNVRLDPSAVEVIVTEGTVKVGAPEKESKPATLEEPRTDGTPRADADVSPGTRARVDASLTITETSPLLSAGHRLVVPLNAGFDQPPLVSAPVDAQAIKQALAWQERRLYFESTPLPQMVAEINRYNRHQLVIVDPQLETHRFGGSFPAGDYEAFVRLLETNFGVVAERLGDETRLRLGRR